MKGYPRSSTGAARAGRHGSPLAAEAAPRIAQRSPRSRLLAPAAGAAGILGALLLLGGIGAASSPEVSGCHVSGSGTAEDLGLARAACDRAEERFTLLFGAAPPAGTVEISDTVSFPSIEGYGLDWKLLWPSSERMRSFYGGSAGSADEVEDAIELQWTTVLPHELGHVMLISETDERRPPDAVRRRLPDWLHEGTAVWMEPPAYRADGQATIRAHRPYVPPLDSLLAFTIAAPEDRPGAGSTVIRTFFPCASEEACAGRPHWSRIFSVTTRQFPDGRVQEDTTFHATPPPPPSPLGSHFYSYSAILVRFLHDRGGTAAMSTLLDRYLRGTDGPAVLAGLPGLPGERRRVQAEWVEWFDRWIFVE